MTTTTHLKGGTSDLPTPCNTDYRCSGDELARRALNPRDAGIEVPRNYTNPGDAGIPCGSGRETPHRLAFTD